MDFPRNLALYLILSLICLMAISTSFRSLSGTKSIIAA
jgi:hypothetical protein